MRAICRTILCLMAAGLMLHASAQAPEGCVRLDARFLECVFNSRSLNREVSFGLQLPADYSIEKGEWPAILFLHGAGRSHRTLWDHPQTRMSLASAKSIVILPEGRNSWWLDSPAQGRYASMALELLDWLTPRLRLSTRREKRATAGWSMGGYGSVRLVQTHPEAFIAWAGILPLLDFPNAAYPPEHNHTVPEVFGPEQRWPLLNPLHSAARLRGVALRFVTASDAFERRMNEAFHHRLGELSIDHRFLIVPGSHRYDVVVQALPETIEWLDSQIWRGSPR